MVIVCSVPYFKFIYSNILFITERYVHLVSNEHYIMLYDLSTCSFTANELKSSIKVKHSSDLHQVEISFSIIGYALE